MKIFQKAFLTTGLWRRALYLPAFLVPRRALNMAVFDPRDANYGSSIAAIEEAKEIARRQIEERLARMATLSTPLGAAQAQQGAPIIQEKSYLEHDALTEAPSPPTEPASVAATEGLPTYTVRHEGPADTSLSLQIASDLHLEFGTEGHTFDAALVPAAPVLALVGDICSLTRERDIAMYGQFLRWCAARWELVLVCTGNHEYYNHGGKVTMDQADATLSKLCATAGPNVVFMQGTGIDVNGVRVLGATLWSDLPTAEITAAVEGHLNDYRLVYMRGRDGRPERLTGAASSELHRQTVAWLTREIEHAPGKTVVLTHHAPTFEDTSAPQYVGLPTTHGFASDLTRLFRPQLRLWAFGHTHFNTDRHHPSGTRVVANQKGYDWMNDAAEGYKQSAIWHV